MINEGPAVNYLFFTKSHWDWELPNKVGMGVGFRLQQNRLGIGIRESLS